MENGSSFLVTFAHEARATYCWCFQNSDVKPVEIRRKSTQYLQLLVQFHALLVVSQSSQASTVLKTCSWSQIESCRTEIWGWNATNTTVLSFKQSAAWKLNTHILTWYCGWKNVWQLWWFFNEKKMFKKKHPPPTPSIFRCYGYVRYVSLRKCKYHQSHSLLILGSPSENGFMEPKHVGFRRWLGPPLHHPLTRWARIPKNWLSGYPRFRVKPGPWTNKNNDGKSHTRASKTVVGHRVVLGRLRRSAGVPKTKETENMVNLFWGL